MNSTRYNQLKNKPVGHQRLFRRGFPGMSRERASRNASTFQKGTNRQPIASRPPVSDPKIYMNVNQIIGIKNSCHALAMTRPGAPISANPASPCIRGNLFIHLPPLLNARCQRPLPNGAMPDPCQPKHSKEKQTRRCFKFICLGHREGIPRGLPHFPRRTDEILAQRIANRTQNQASSNRPEYRPELARRFKKKFYRRWLLSAVSENMQVLRLP